MAFPLVPVLIALALYVLHDDETQNGEKVNRKTASSRKNKIEKTTALDIDDSANSVPDSAPQPPENSVPTDIPPENPPESQNVQ